MNPKIKEALSFDLKEDEETERILTFIADFIKEYSYLLLEGTIFKFNCTFYYTGQYGRTRIKENTIVISHPLDKNISRSITTSFNRSIIYELLKKEGAQHLDQPTTNWYCNAKVSSDTWHLGFKRL